MRIVQAESTEYPLLLDTKSSETTIFERQDIVEVEREGQTYYRYTEHQYPLSEWLRARVPQFKGELDLISPLVITADKTTIAADDIDTATITVQLPVEAEYCFVTVNGEVAEKATITDGAVSRGFTASTPGIYRVDFYAINRVATAFIEVIADV